MDWDKLRTFHIVSEAGSFTHAGSTLGLSQSAISRQISNLEESLDVKLFQRHARGLVLTEAGELLSDTARDIFARLSILEGQLADSKNQLSGSLRITAPDFLGATWLVPKLNKLHVKYPELQLSLLFDDRILNLSMREADVAIRLYKPDQNDIAHHAIGKVSFHICGSKEYFKRHGKPKTVKELKEHTLIGFPNNVAAPYEDPNWLLRKANIQFQNNPKLIQMNSQFAILRGVHNGMGLAALPDYLADTDDDIVTCLDDVKRPAVTMYYVYMEDRKSSSRIQLLKDFLTDQ